MDCHPPGSSVHDIFPSKNIGLGCHFLLQGIFLTQRLNPHLMHRWLDFLTTVLPGKPPLLSEVKVKSLSCVWLFSTLWTVGHQAPPSMGFSRQEYWSGVLLLVPVGMWIRLAVFDFELWLNSGWIRLKEVSSSTSGWAWMWFRIYWDGL